HADKLCERVRFGGHLEWHDGCARLQSRSELIVQFGKDLFARGAFGTERVRLTAPRPVTIPCDCFDQNGDLHGCCSVDWDHFIISHPAASRELALRTSVPWHLAQRTVSLS